MVNENKRLNYTILTDDTTPLIINTATPPTINTVIRAKSALYTANLNVGL